MDIELAIDALELAPYIDHMVLFSGDGDFRSLVEAMQRRGVRVSVVSTISTQPPMVADELRRQADEFLDLAHLIPKIGRDPAERPPRLASARTASAASARASRRRRGLERRYGIRQAPAATTTAVRELSPSGIAWPGGRRRARRHPLSRISRAFSRFQVRSFSVSRLSCSFLPRPSPSSTFARPRSLK